MKKLIRNILALVAVLAIIDLAFGYIMDYCKSHAKGGDTMIEYNGFCRVNQDILLFGSSRCMHHYNPSIITDSTGMSCYNVGKDGLGIIYHYAKLTAILEYHKPKVVVYDVITSFDLVSEHGYDKYIASFRPYYGLGETEEIIADMSPMEHYKNFSSMYKYNHVFIQMISDNINPRQKVMGNGYKPIDKLMTVFPEIEQDKPIVDIDSLKYKYLCQFIARCKKEGIKLIFSLSPCYKKTFSIAYTPIINLCKKENIPFLDFYSHPEFALNRDYFYDSTHLNCNGADAYTRKFAEELKKLACTK